MALTKLTKDIAYISKLDNNPSDDTGMTPYKLRELFDQSGQDIKSYINNSFIPELEAELSDKLSNTTFADAVLEAAEAALTEALTSGKFDGADGRNVLLQVSSEYVQWRYAGDAQWTNLIAISALKGSVGEGGPKGDKGDKGDKGEKGDTGERGPQGIAGVATATTGLFAFNVTGDGHLMLSFTGDITPGITLDENGHLIWTT